jgi:hypothetical protein
LGDRLEIRIILVSEDIEEVLFIGRISAKRHVMTGGMCYHVQQKPCQGGSLATWQPRKAFMKVLAYNLKNAFRTILVVH